MDIKKMNYKELSNLAYKFRNMYQKYFNSLKNDIGYYKASKIIKNLINKNNVFFGAIRLKRDKVLLDYSILAEGLKNNYFKRNLTI